MFRDKVFLARGLVILTFITTILFILNFFSKEEIVENENKDKVNIIEHKLNQTIKVKLCKSNEILDMDINDYLRGVVPSEMSPTYEIEALKAQALVARTYMYKKIETGAEGEGADMCDSFAHCQAFYEKEKLFEIWRKKGYSDKDILLFWDKINEAVVSTQNEIITFDGKCIKAFFHASSPEKTEDVSQIWGGENLPYLKSVANVEDEDYINRTSKVELSLEEFFTKLTPEVAELAAVNFQDSIDVKISDYTSSGRVKNIEINGIKISAEKLRTLLGLKSTNFNIESVANKIIFNVIGYGHGVGMSQVGANYLAKNGKTYDEIIKYYYAGIEITKVT